MPVAFSSHINNYIIQTSLISQAPIDTGCGATLLHSGLWDEVPIVARCAAHAQDQRLHFAGRLRAREMVRVFSGIWACPSCMLLLPTLREGFSPPHAEDATKAVLWVGKRIHPTGFSCCKLTQQDAIQLSSVKGMKAPTCRVFLHSN